MNIFDVKKLLESSKGTIFTVTFTKRTTGEERVMNCRLGVTKGLQGGERAYDPDSKGLLFVWDLVKEAYRSIPLDAIRAVSVKGQKYSFI